MSNINDKPSPIIPQSNTLRKGILTFEETPRRALGRTKRLNMIEAGEVQVAPVGQTSKFPQDARMSQQGFHFGKYRSM